MVVEAFDLNRDFTLIFTSDQALKSSFSLTQILKNFNLGISKPLLERAGRLR